MVATWTDHEWAHDHASHQKPVHRLLIAHSVKEAALCWLGDSQCLRFHTSAFSAQSAGCWSKKLWASFSFLDTWFWLPGLSVNVNGLKKPHHSFCELSAKAPKDRGAPGLANFVQGQLEVRGGGRELGPKLTLDQSTNAISGASLETVAQWNWKREGVSNVWQFEDGFWGVCSQFVGQF